MSDYKPVNFNDIKSNSLNLKYENKDRFISFINWIQKTNKNKSKSYLARQQNINNNSLFFEELKNIWVNRCSIQYEIYNSEKPKTCFFCDNLYTKTQDQKCKIKLYHISDVIYFFQTSIISASFTLTSASI